eukprot:6033717-Pleurochrysis_carterae.AAC.1
MCATPPPPRRPPPRLGGAGVSAYLRPRSPPSVPRPRATGLSVAARRAAVRASPPRRWMPR